MRPWNIVAGPAGRSEMARCRHFLTYFLPGLWVWKEKVNGSGQISTIFYDSMWVFVWTHVISATSHVCWSAHNDFQMEMVALVQTCHLSPWGVKIYNRRWSSSRFYLIFPHKIASWINSRDTKKSAMQTWFPLSSFKSENSGVFGCWQWQSWLQVRCTAAHQAAQHR